MSGQTSPSLVLASGKVQEAVGQSRPAEPQGRSQGGGGTLGTAPLRQFRGRPPGAKAPA